MAEDRVQRRLAAILAVDVVGYSKLMGADEEGTFTRLRVHQRTLLDPVVEAHNGRIFKEGTAEEIENDPAVQEIYLGGGHG